MPARRKIEKIQNGSLIQALELVWQVFLEFEAPDYSEEGVREFKSFIELEAVRKKVAEGELLVWGCMDGDEIIGVLALRPPCHIALLFVDKRCHRQGIARALFETALGHCKANGDDREMTVNSSPYAAEAYRRLGFVDTGAEQTVNGIRFIPMKHTFQ